MHRIKPGNLAAYINNFNSTYAGRLTPAGQALVNAGSVQRPLSFRPSGARFSQLAHLPQTTAISNPTFRSLDVNFSYPIRL